METSATVDVVIVSYNVKSVLKDCLHSIADLPSGFTIYVVDNASSDGTAEMIQSEFPRVEFISSGANIGFSPANNLAMQKGKGEYILLLNPDTIVKQPALIDWLNLHIEKQAGLSACKLLNTDQSLQISAWKTPGVMDSLLELFYLHRLFHITQYPEEMYQRDAEVENVSGAAMLFSRKVFDEVGGLDPNLFWMEDTDFCYRVRSSGKKVIYFHEPEIVHIGGQSSKSNYNRVISNQLISRLKFTRKHRSMVSFVVLTLIIYLHCISRIIGFGLIYPLKRNAKAKAYIYSFGRLNRYIWKKDMSI
ncbi:MAG: glycosyltransferase family 2 protein [Flavobacteriales bacterium]|nr:glycosyltransferase family 2 protein [Flavobacteriales bacterium]